MENRALTGAAGEHYVAFRLAAMGYAVGLTTRGTRSIDLIVANPNTGKSITIQTKTMRNALGRSGEESWWKWRMGVGAFDKPTHNDFFYALVDLKGDPSKIPDIFIVPSADMKTPLLEDYRDKKSGEVTDVWCVIYRKDASKYQDKWDIIKKALG